MAGACTDVSAAGDDWAASMRDLTNAIFFMPLGGVSWRMLPMLYWFTRFREDRTGGTLNDHLVMLGRVRACREASPTADVIDTQSAKTTAAGGLRE